jgi:hypothetical protein
MSSSSSVSPSSDHCESPKRQSKKCKNALFEHLSRSRKKRQYVDRSNSLNNLAQYYHRNSIAPGYFYKHFAWWTTRYENMFADFTTELEAGLKLEAKDFDDEDE